MPCDDTGDPARSWPLQARSGFPPRGHYIRPTCSSAGALHAVAGKLRTSRQAGLPIWPTGETHSLDQGTQGGQCPIMASQLDRAGGGVCLHQSQLFLSDRKSVVSGQSVSLSVDIGGRHLIKKKKNQRNKND